MAANSGCRVGSPPMTLIVRQTFPRRRDSSTKRSIWLRSMRSALGACRQLRLQLRHFRLHSYVTSISIISRHDRYCGPSNAVAARRDARMAAEPLEPIYRMADRRQPSCIAALIFGKSHSRLREDRSCTRRSIWPWICRQVLSHARPGPVMDGTAHSTAGPTVKSSAGSFCACDAGRARAPDAFANCAEVYFSQK